MDDAPATRLRLAGVGPTADVGAHCARVDL